MQSSQLSTSSVISSTLPTLPNVALAVSSPRLSLVPVVDSENDDVPLTFQKQSDGVSNRRFIDPTIDTHYNHQSSHCYDSHGLLKRKRRSFVNFPSRGGGLQGTTTTPLNTMKDMFQDNNNFGNNIRFNFDNGDDGGDGGGDSFTDIFYDDGPSSPSSSAASKVASSLFGLIFGPFIIFASCALLWQNEKWAIKTHRSLNEALNAVQSIPSNTSTSTAGDIHQDENIYNEKLIHYTGPISAHGSPYDYDFQLQRPNSISIQRQVEIYQWVETKHETRRKLQDGRTQRKVTYSYNKRWTDRPIRSENFRRSSDYRNVGYLPFESETFYADQVFIGPYQLPNEIFGSRLNVGSTMIHPRELEYIPQGGLIEGTSIYFPSTATTTNPTKISGGSPKYEIETTVVPLNDEEDTILYKIADTGELFHTKKEAMKKVAMLQQYSSNVAKPTSSSSLSQQHKIIGSEPQIGDVRVRFSEVKCKPATVVGKLSGDNIVEWQSNQGEGYDVALFQYGTFHAKDLVENAQSKNTFFSWALRGGGFLLSYVGFSMTTSIISATANLTLNWIPLLGPMATTIINVGLTFANFVLASSLSLLVASVSWLFYRPLIGTPLLIGSFGIFYMASQLGVVGENVRGNNVNLKRE